jgi:hypothetical protein
LCTSPLRHINWVSVVSFLMFGTQWYDWKYKVLIEILSDVKYLQEKGKMYKHRYRVWPGSFCWLRSLSINDKTALCMCWYNRKWMWMSPPCACRTYIEVSRVDMSHQLYNSLRYNQSDKNRFVLKWLNRFSSRAIHTIAIRSQRTNDIMRIGGTTINIILDEQISSSTRLRFIG